MRGGGEKREGRGNRSEREQEGGLRVEKRDFCH